MRACVALAFLVVVVGLSGVHACAYEDAREERCGSRSGATAAGGTAETALATVRSVIAANIAANSLHHVRSNVLAAPSAGVEYARLRACVCVCVLETIRIARKPQRARVYVC